MRELKNRIPLWGAASLYIGAGVAHFLRPSALVTIVPPWVPDADAVVFWSGAFELIFGLGLLWARSRYISAIGIIGLLIAVFPANVQMAKDWIERAHPSAWVAVARLPLQGLLIFWAWKVRKR